ncbi:hypothetical protein Dsin_021844 [Dipteronia sinensis]|uniref:Uncharacterized protein n=1 Tax=Dipteronia sinensis TaxID=43782 RepID=A0AAE0DZI0_9ROSI|nr:hypothetical protein Dsin_021844 [Dipteronia sinensis]
MHQTQPEAVSGVGIGIIPEWGQNVAADDILGSALPCPVLLVPTLSIEDGEKLKKKTKKTKTKISREPQQPQTMVNQKQVLDDPKTQKGAVPPGWPLQPPLFLLVSLSAQSAELDAI